MKYVIKYVISLYYPASSCLVGTYSGFVYSIIQLCAVYFCKSVYRLVILCYSFDVILLRIERIYLHYTDVSNCKTTCISLTIYLFSCVFSYFFQTFERQSI